MDSRNAKPHLGNGERCGLIAHAQRAADCLRDTNKNKADTLKHRKLDQAHSAQDGVVNTLARLARRRDQPDLIATRHGGTPARVLPPSGSMESVEWPAVSAVPIAMDAVVDPYEVLQGAMQMDLPKTLRLPRCGATSQRLGLRPRPTHETFVALRLSA